MWEPWNSLQPFEKTSQVENPSSVFSSTSDFEKREYSNLCQERNRSLNECSLDTITISSPQEAIPSRTKQGFLVYLLSRLVQAIFSMETNDLYSDERFKPCRSIRPSKATRRLYWTLHISSASIAVMNRECNPDGPHEVYTDSHVIAHEPATTPPIAIFSVSETYLNCWQDSWWTLNGMGWDVDEEPDNISEKPPLFKPLTITASNGRFITINDYISTLHPWLIQRLDLIIRAKFSWDTHFTTPDPEARWLVDLGRPAIVGVEEQDDWHETLKGRFEDLRMSTS